MKINDLQFFVTKKTSLQLVLHTINPRLKSALIFIQP
ncbi:Hypothetical protein Minf_1475 [Methylacidiphilum infernorum V4]|uniref:Uncharacterized protein n=1 Tax=Methylacidiphilum infernorum (isolate V4) TaxID=481448 RepID=B3DW26_METI4|nr:Hypothetical protein Minf_1475 [Methylacidiphilum infernorum V4]